MRLLVFFPQSLEESLYFQLIKYGTLNVHARILHGTVENSFFYMIAKNHDNTPNGAKDIKHENCTSIHENFRTHQFLRGRHIPSHAQWNREAPRYRYARGCQCARSMQVQLATAGVIAQLARVNDVFYSAHRLALRYFCARI